MGHAVMRATEDDPRPTTHDRMDYREALDFLFPRTTTIKFGLDTTRQLLARLGAPHRLIPDGRWVSTSA